MNPLKKCPKIFLPVLIGLGGFALNQFAVEIGFGVHFLFGSVLGYSFVRLLKPWHTGIAVSIASVETVLLWHHPWAWLIWTVEGLVVAYSFKKTSPISAGLLFWITFGVPALFVTYGIFLEFDITSLILVIEKQFLNGILNIVLGEFVFLIFTFSKNKIYNDFKLSVPTSHIIMTVSFFIIIFPILLWVRIDSAVQVNSIVRDVQTQLEYSAREIDTLISSWLHASTETTIVAAQLLLSTEMRGDTIIDMMSSIEYLEVFDREKNIIKSSKESEKKISYNNSLVDELIQSGDVQVSDLVFDGVKSHVDIYHQIRHDDEVLYVHAGVKLGAFADRLFGSQKRFSLLDSAGKFLTVCAACQISDIELKRIRALVRDNAAEQPLIHFNEAFGTSLMTSMKDATLYGVYKFSDSHPWFVLLERPLSAFVVNLRYRQAMILAGAAFVVCLLWIVAWAFARKVIRDLQLLISRSTELFEMGHSNERINQVVLHEFGTIADRLKAADEIIKKGRASVREFKYQFDVITKYAPVVLYKVEIKDLKKAKILTVTDSATRLLGYSINAFYREGFLGNITHPEDFDRTSKIFSGLSPGAHRSQDYRLRREDGKFIWVFDTLVVPDQSESEHALRGYGVILDISVKKSAEEKLNQASRMISLGEMAAGMAHELNQPLNLIRIAIENLEISLANVQGMTTRDLRRIDRIKSSVERASKLVTHMRLFGKASSAERRIFCIREVISNCLQLLKADLEAVKTELVCAKPDEDLLVFGSKDLVEQVFVNLFLNARDAFRRREFDVDMKSIIKIDLNCTDGEVIIGVRDNAGGIDELIMPNIFEPFVSSKPDVHGTGLGLSVSFGIIEDHGGSIAVENVDGGAEFTIVLPRANKIQRSK